MAVRLISRVDQWSNQIYLERIFLILADTEPERLEILIYKVEFRGTWVKSLIEF